MNQFENPSNELDFKQKLKDIKDYILALLSWKQKKITQEVKSQVENIIKKEPSFIDTLKNIFWNKEKKDEQKNPPNKYESHREDRDEYIPHDMEFWESVWEWSRFAEIFPWYTGYFTSGKKSYFDPTTNLWSKKKQLSAFNFSPDTTKKSYVYAWILTAGIISIPLPEWSFPDISSLKYNGKTTPIFQKDQNNGIYLISKEKQYVSFTFYTHQKIDSNPPIAEDSEKIIFKKLKKETRNLLSTLHWDRLSAEKIKQYILKTKKYSTRLQWTLRDSSNEKNYISNLDESEVLECFSANSLFVWLCREIGIPSRLVVWHMVQSLDSEWKSLLSWDNWHAWSEIWDERSHQWIRIDGTPTIKEDWEKSNQNIQEENQEWNKNQENDTDGNNTEEWNEKKENTSWEKTTKEKSWNKDSWWNQKEPDTDEKSPTEALDELIEKARNDNMAKQWEKLKDTIDKLEQAQSKEEIRDILDESKLSDFAKDMINTLWNEEILKQEQEQLKKLEEEKDVDNYTDNSLLDDDFKKKLNEYGREIKKKIQEEKKKLKNEMQKMWFQENEIRLYKLYKTIEIEIDPEVKKQIRALEKILPPLYKTISNEDEYFASWVKLGSTTKLIEYELTWDTKIFRRENEKRQWNEINMFETIIIDRSWSMWRFEDTNSPLRETVKAAIIRAKVLEHFKVHFSIILFDTQVEEVMKFWEKFSDKKKNTIPARFMRWVIKNGWTDIGQPLTYCFESMKKYSHQMGWKSFWNISFLWDGAPTDGLKNSALLGLITQIKSAWFGLTAYYINGSSQQKNELQRYFWNEESGWTIIVSQIKDLTEKLIGSYNTNLKKIIKKYTK